MSENRACPTTGALTLGADITSIGNVSALLTAPPRLPAAYSFGQRISDRRKAMFEYEVGHDAGMVGEGTGFALGPPCLI